MKAPCTIRLDFHVLSNRWGRIHPFILWFRQTCDFFCQNNVEKSKIFLALLKAAQKKVKESKIVNVSKEKFPFHIIWFSFISSISPGMVYCFKHNENVLFDWFFFFVYPLFTVSLHTRMEKTKNIVLSIQSGFHFRRWNKNVPKKLKGTILCGAPKIIKLSLKVKKFILTILNWNYLTEETGKNLKLTKSQRQNYN